MLKKSPGPSQARVNETMNNLLNSSLAIVRPFSRFKGAIVNRAAPLQEIATFVSRARSLFFLWRPAHPD